MAEATQKPSRIKLTKTAVAAIKAQPGQQVIVWDKELSGFGVRASAGGAKSYIYQGRVRGRVRKETLGRVEAFDHPDDAREEARTFAANFRKGIITKKSLATVGNTLGDLLTAYGDLLESEGKVSAAKVRTEIKAGVEKAQPKLWRTPAEEITIDDCMHIVGDLNAKGNPRQADKLRSYIKAAYSRAINARYDVSAPKAMRDMQLVNNPCREITKVKGSTNANHRILSLAEFRAYWARIQALSEPHRSVAMLHVLTGGQRIIQLSRVTVADVDRDSMTLTMRDSKGRRQEPRVYQIPLLTEALECIDGITGAGRYVFSADGGERPMSTQFLTDISASVCKAMQEAGELEGEPFTAKHIRATIESRLMDSPYEVSSDVLARLLSHGLGGVQAKHYARDPLMNRQREALHKLLRLLNNEAEPGAVEAAA